MNAPRPIDIVLHKRSRELEIGYADGTRYRLPAEYLRVHSPSAEVQGHGKPVLVGGKRPVAITAVQPVGRYAVKLVFDDGHDTGLFSWDVLDDLGRNHSRYWAEYERRLAKMGMSRDSEVVTLAALTPRKYTPPRPPQKPGSNS
ncbi:gamma-butyrobetaine hydroxylase-like domain-containing protein [Panacagrimonas sp.]|uniref:gamma-butyrobetaine hydroxylase-like domain-containing protein n=1 Tax=Panacagrimonas sp. TaxID=2480088 RepID=UPI003B52F694